MNAIRNIVAATALSALAAPAFAGSTPPTPTPVAPSVVQFLSTITPAQARAALSALTLRDLPATLPAGLKSQALAVLTAIAGNASLAAQLGVSQAEILELLERVRAIPVRA